MRLSLYEVKTIIKLKIKYFGENTKIYLFGSRTDDTQKGGDIDLFIESYDFEDKFEKKILFLSDLDKIIGEQQVDVVFAKDKNRPIEIEAYKGIELNLEKIKLAKYFTECDKHIQRIDEAYGDVSDILPLSTNKFENLTKDEVQAIDQYLFRFAKLQDTIGDKIFKMLVARYQDNVTSIPFIDVLNMLEKLGYLYSSKEWINLRKIRNEISHQYDDEPEEMSKSINNILNQKDIIKNIYIKVRDKWASKS